MYALEIDNLNKRYKNFSLQNINLKLQEGYILGYVGQNGAGKTTTIKLIMEHLKKDSGEIKVFGKKYKDNNILYKNMIGYISDECYFPGNLTFKDLSNILMDFYVSFDKQKFQFYLEKWGLTKNKYINQLSKGMKMKTMFASILARDTKLLVLDEATSGLDPVIRDEILEILQEYISDGKKSVIFSTHIMSDLEKIADYIYFINRGKTILYDTKDEMLEKYLLIKGGTLDLTSTIKKKLIGLKESSIGFEGLINQADKNIIGTNILCEVPTIEDIIIYHIKGN